MILAFCMNAAIGQQVKLHLKECGQWEAAEKKIKVNSKAESNHITRANYPRATKAWVL